MASKYEHLTREELEQKFDLLGGEDAVKKLSAGKPAEPEKSSGPRARQGGSSTGPKRESSTI